MCRVDKANHCTLSLPFCLAQTLHGLGKARTAKGRSSFLLLIQTSLFQNPIGSSGNNNVCPSIGTAISSTKSIYKINHARASPEGNQSKPCAFRWKGLLNITEIRASLQLCACWAQERCLWHKQEIVSFILTPLNSSFLCEILISRSRKVSGLRDVQRHPV